MEKYLQFISYKVEFIEYIKSSYKLVRKTKQINVLRR